MQTKNVGLRQKRPIPGIIGVKTWGAHPPAGGLSCAMQH
jgi:hypothetical protein